MANAKMRGPLRIGIHLTPEAAHMVQFEPKGDGLHLVSKASCTFTTPADTISRLMAAADPTAHRGADANYAAAQRFVRQKMGLNGFKGKDVVISVPSDLLEVQHVRMPPMQPVELAAALPNELHGKLPFAPEQAVIRHIVAGTVAEDNETKQDVLVLAVRRDDVQAHVSALAKMHFNVVGVGVEPCSMCYGYAYAAEHAEPSQSGPLCLMMVYLGWQRSNVAILRGRETIFVKPVDHGLDHLVQAVAHVKDMPLDEASEVVASWRNDPTPERLDEAVAVYNRCRPCTGRLTDEIQSCMRYHASLARGARIDRLVFVGPGAHDKALVRVLSATLSVPCEIGDPVGAVTGSPDPQSAEPEMAVAVGLSLFGTS